MVVLPASPVVVIVLPASPVVVVVLPASPVVVVVLPASPVVVVVLPARRGINFSSIIKQPFSVKNNYKQLTRILLHNLWWTFVYCASWIIPVWIKDCYTENCISS